MSCQVNAQSVVAKSCPLVQGSGVPSCFLVSTGASWPNARVDEKKKNAAAKAKNRATYRRSEETAREKDCVFIDRISLQVFDSIRIHVTILINRRQVAL